jgi:hypothetical protein
MWRPDTGTLAAKPVTPQPPSASGFNVWPGRKVGTKSRRLANNLFACSNLLALNFIVTL